MKNILVFFFLFFSVSLLFADLTSDPAAGAADNTGDRISGNSDGTFDDYYDFDYGDDGITIVSAVEESQQIETVTKEEIEKLNPSDLADALEKSFNLSVKRYGSYGSNTSISLRGFGGGRVLILVDGIPMNSAQSGEFDLGMIPLNDVEEIQVISGGSDSKYNFSGAVGGIINIITKKKNEAGYSINSSASSKFYYPGFYYSDSAASLKTFSSWYDFFDTQNLNFAFGIGSKKIYWDIKGEWNRAWNHYLYEDDNGKYRRRENNEILDGNARTSVRIQLPHYMQLIFSGSFLYANKNIPGAINSANIGNQEDFLATGALFFDADFAGHERIDTELIINYKFHRLNWSDTSAENTHDLNTIQIVNRWGFLISDWLSLNTGGDFELHYLQ